MVLGVFGGAFDPPHLGHALLPSYLLARGWVDRVIVAPCADHPLGKTMSPFAARLAWTRLAMRFHGTAVAVTDLEDRLARAEGGPSYTLRLLRALAQEHPGARIRLVVGSDIVHRGGQHRWHRWDEIEREFAPIIVPRAGYADPTTCPLPEVSSTQIRAALARRDWDGLASLLPAAVLAVLRAGPRGHVWLVGRGHVQAHLEPWLAGRGYRVTTIGARAWMRGEEPAPEAPPDAIFITIRDGEILSFSERMSKKIQVDPSIPVLHAAGSLQAADVLEPWARRGHPVGTMHPICSLRRGAREGHGLEGAAFGIEGDAPARAWIEGCCSDAVTVDLQGLDASARRAYHAACALVANHLPVLVEPAVQTLARLGQPREIAWPALLGLLVSAAENLAVLGVPDGVTGPVSRGEFDVVRAHADALDGETAALYVQLSDALAHILARARPGRPGA